MVIWGSIFVNLNLLHNWRFFFDGFLVVHYWDILFDQNCGSVVLTSDCRCIGTAMGTGPEPDLWISIRFHGSGS